MQNSPFDLLPGLQGAFEEHIRILESLAKESKRLGSEIPLIESVISVKSSCQLWALCNLDSVVKFVYHLDALILPGGESTTMAILAEKNGLWAALKDWIHVHRRPVWVSHWARVPYFQQRNATSPINSS